MSLPLRSLSDCEVLSRTKTLSAQERGLTLKLLLHLNEVERRALFLKDGYGSMFVYCSAGLGYSTSAAKRRLCTARCIARYPEVLGLLEANEVNLSTITQVSRILRPWNSSVVLARIRGKSQREVEAVVAEYEPLTALPRERVRTVVVRVPVKAAVEPAPVSRSPDPDVKPGGKSGDVAPSMNQDRNGPDPGAQPAQAMQLERRAVVQFCAHEVVMTKLDHVRALASHRLPVNAPLEQVIEFLADYFIEREDPAQRHARREERKQNENGQSQTRRTASSERAAHSIPTRVRDQVFMRDKQQCTYVSPGGKRCASTHVLQIDHIKPVARGGTSTIDNLRVLCAYHNRFEAERLMGRSGPREPTSG